MNMSGAYSRNKGARYERECANELSARLGLDIVTTRSLGANYGSDLATVTAYDAHGRPVTHDPAVLGWAVETKNVATRNPKQWLTQATEQAAPGLRPVVLWKRPRASWEDGSAFVWDKSAPRGWWEMPIKSWVDGLQRQQMECRHEAERAGWGGPWPAGTVGDVQEACDQIVADRLANGTWTM